MNTWSEPVVVGAPAGLYNITGLHAVGDARFASSNGGGVAVLEDARWRTIVTEDAAAKALGERLGMQHCFVGRGGALWGLCVGSARIVALDATNGAWSPLGEATPKLKLSWALCAYDPTRDTVVVWGPMKSDGTRSDATLIWHSGAWTKPKKSAPVPAADLARDSGAFCLAYSPRHGGVVRVATTAAAIFDGKGWQPLRLAGAELLHTWERAPCVLGDDALLVQRFNRQPGVVRLGGDASAVVVERVCALPSLVQRKPNDSGGNVVVDVVCVDARGVLSGYDEQKKSMATLDLKSAAAR